MKDLEKLKHISLITIISDLNNLDNVNYYKIVVSNPIDIELNINQLSVDKFLFQINEIGMIYSEIYIGKAKKENFISLDEFMEYTRIPQLGRDIEERAISLLKYPYKKEKLLSKDDFESNFNTYFNEDFMMFSNESIVIDFSLYKEGYFYFNSSSVITLGCELGDEYWYFSFQPYI